MTGNNSKRLYLLYNSLISYEDVDTIRWGRGDIQWFQTSSLFHFYCFILSSSLRSHSCFFQLCWNRFHWTLQTTWKIFNRNWLRAIDSPNWRASIYMCDRLGWCIIARWTASSRQLVGDSNRTTCSPRRPRLRRACAPDSPLRPTGRRWNDWPDTDLPLETCLTRGWVDRTWVSVLHCAWFSSNKFTHTVIDMGVIVLTHRACMI